MLRILSAQVNLVDTRKNLTSNIAKCYQVALWLSGTLNLFDTFLYDESIALIPKNLGRNKDEHDQMPWYSNEVEHYAKQVYLKHELFWTNNGTKLCKLQSYASTKSVFPCLCLGFS